jgi:hypothetical protein
MGGQSTKSTKQLTRTHRAMQEIRQLRHDRVGERDEIVADVKHDGETRAGELQLALVPTASNKNNK